MKKSQAAVRELPPTVKSDDKHVKLIRTASQWGCTNSFSELFFLLLGSLASLLSVNDIMVRKS